MGMGRPSVAGQVVAGPHHRSPHWCAQIRLARKHARDGLTSPYVTAVSGHLCEQPTQQPRHAWRVFEDWDKSGDKR